MPSSPAAVLPDHRWIVRAAGCGLMVLPAAVLCGWALHLEGLKSVVPGAVQMKANTAAGLLLAGLALGFPGRRVSVLRLLTPLCGALVGLLGLATLAEYVAGVDLDIDELLFRDQARAST